MTTPPPSYTILHRDRTLLVVNKAAGVLTVPVPGSRERCLLDDLRRDALPVAPVHRLDRETSGALLLCLAPAHRAALEALFRDHLVTKEYLALVHGIPQVKAATIDVPILDEGAVARVDRRGQRAVTHYSVAQVFAVPHGAVSLLSVQLDTGRHNQIRVHLAHLGHALVGDRKYGRKPDAARARGPAVDAKRCMLHAERLALRHPASGAPLDVRAPLPDDFAELLASLPVSDRGSGGTGRSRS